MQKTDIAHLLRTGNIRKIETPSFSDYIVVAAEYFRENDMRMGRAYFEVLSEIRPDIAAEINGTERDAFHDNGRLPAMLSYVYKRWV